MPMTISIGVGIPALPIVPRTVLIFQYKEIFQSAQKQLHVENFSEFIYLY